MPALRDDRQVRPWRLAWKWRHGFTRLVTGALVVLLMPTIAFQLGRRVETLEEAVASATPPAPRDVTTPVEFRVLEVGEVFRGTVRVSAISVLAPDSGVVVALLLEPGDVIHEGGLVAVIDDRPLALLQGDLPLLADLRFGSAGSWVLQAQEALMRLGFYELELDGEYGPGTQRAASEFYSSLDFVSPSKAPDGGGSDSESFSFSGRPDGALIPHTEVLFLPSLPASVVRVHAQRGDIVAADQPLLDLTTGEPVVELKVSAQDAQRFPEGEAVLIRLEEGDVEGVVTTVTMMEDEAGRSDWVVAIEPSSPLPFELDGKSLLVVVGAVAEADPQLVLPASAIRFNASGMPYVSVQMSEEEYRSVEVITGLETGGFVIVSPVSDALEEGDRVRIGLPASPDV